jgi:hypothetical protein
MELAQHIENKEEKGISLGSTKSGQVFRFAFLSFEEALKEDAFFMVVEAPEKQGILVVNLKDGKQILRDKDHRVIIHEAKLSLIK